jgi:dimethylamine monooxygenase subunit A
MQRARKSSKRLEDIPMTSPRFTPYDGSSKPFTIGLKALAPRAWLEIDDDLETYLAEKEQLLKKDRDLVFQEIEGSRKAQIEALNMVLAYLNMCHGDKYKKADGRVRFLDRAVSLDSDAPLIIAGSLVADDMTILENRDGGWRITAGYVSFPSSWSLKEKAALTIGEVHGPVPEFGEGSRNDELITRMFDRLPPGRFVERFNWSIYPDGELHWPPEHAKKAAEKPFDAKSSFIRIERQTLCRLPETGAILFTVRIYRDPISTILTHSELANGLAQQLEELTPEQAEYKGMTQKRAELLTFMRKTCN